MGIIAAANISKMLNMISKKDENEIMEVIKNYKLPVQIQKLSYNKIIDAMKLDKKVKDNKINFVLLKGIGSTVIKNNISESLIKKVINELENRGQKSEARGQKADL